MFCDDARAVSLNSFLLPDIFHGDRAGFSRVEGQDGFMFSVARTTVMLAYATPYSYYTADVGAEMSHDLLPWRVVLQEIVAVVACILPTVLI